MEKVARFVSFHASKVGEIDQNQKSKIKNQKFFNWFILLGIVLFSSFLRLYRIGDYLTFLGDEGRDVLVVYGILHGKFTLLGPTASVGGFFLGPIYYYFMTPFLWLFNYNPVGPAIMVGLFGIATAFFVYKVGSQFFDKKVGLIAAFLYSISPLVIAHSRSSWNPNLMPFFSLLTLYVLYKAVVENKAKLFVFCGFLLGITMQLHYLATFLGVIVGVYVLFSRAYAVRVCAISEHSESSKDQNIRQSVSEKNQKSKNSEHLTYRNSDNVDLPSIPSFPKRFAIRIFKDYFYILVGFLIGWSPFLAFEVRHGFPNIQSIVYFVLNQDQSGPTVERSFLATIYNVFFRLFGRLVTNFPPSEQVSLGVHSNVTLWYFGTLILGVIGTLLLLRKLIVSLDKKDQFQKISLLALWFIFGVGFFGFYKKPIYDYYFGFMFPLPFILVGNMLVVLYANIHEYARYIVGSIFKREVNRGRHEFTRIRLIGRALAVGIFISLVWVNVQGIPFRFPANRQLAQVEEISRFVIDKTDSRPFNFALITGGNSDHAYRYFFTLWNKSPITIDNFQKDPERETVTDQLLVVCETMPCGVLGHSLWEVAGFGRAEIVDEWDVSVVRVVKLKHYEGEN